MGWRIRRRSAAWLGAFLVAGAALAGCGPASGKPDKTGQGSAVTLPPWPGVDPSVDLTKLDKELNVFNWTEYLPDEIRQHFEQTYKVKVNYDTYSSNEEMHAKLKAGGSGYDLVVPSDFEVQVLRREELLEPLDPAKIPNLANLDPQFMSKEFDPSNKFTVPYMWGTTGIAINTAKLSPDAIKSLADLWKPELKGKLVFPNDARETIGVALRVTGHSLNTADQPALDLAKAKLLALKPNIKAYDSDSPKDLLLSGEVWAGVVWSGEAAKAMLENKQIHYLIPAEGSTVWMDNMAIPKGAPHKYTAEVFMNYLLDPAVSVRLSVAYPYGNPNKAALQYLPAEYRENPAIQPPQEALGKAEWLVDLGDEANRRFDQLWTELKSE